MNNTSKWALGGAIKQINCPDEEALASDGPSYAVDRVLAIWLCKLKMYVCRLKSELRGGCYVTHSALPPTVVAPLRAIKANIAQDFNLLPL